MLVLKHYCSAKQLTDYTCGPACTRSLLNFAKGLNISEEQMARDCHTTSRDGTTPANMVKALWKHGLPAKVATLDRKTIMWLLHQDKPVPILWGDWSEGGHWVVVIGYDPKKRTFLMADPAAPKGLRCHKWSMLNRYWHAKIRGKNYRNIGIVIGAKMARNPTDWDEINRREIEKEAQDRAIIQAMQKMVESHVSFAKDGGVGRDSCWENLADTVQEEKLLPTWGPLWRHLENAFDEAWPQRARRRRANPRVRAPKGGTTGVNNEFYEGGKFLPSRADRAKQAPAHLAAGRKAEIAPRQWANRPEDWAMPLWGTFKHFIDHQHLQRTGTAVINANETALAHYGGREHIQAAVDLFNRGVRWIYAGGHPKAGQPI